MLFLPLLLYCCTTGVQSQDQLYQLNDDGYIECYEDLDCPLPIELPEENSFMQFRRVENVSHEESVARLLADVGAVKTSRTFPSLCR